MTDQQSNRSLTMGSRNRDSPDRDNSNTGPLQPRHQRAGCGRKGCKLERITDMAAASDRSHKRSSDLLKQRRDYDWRGEPSVHAPRATLAAEVDRLN